MSKVRNTSKLYIIAGVLMVLICLAYSNHFNNGFYFDDTHTIVDNEYIKDISNIPNFFTEIASFGTMPGNRGFRPLVTTLNAIDYWMAGELNPKYFHASIFFHYLILLGLLYCFFSKIFNLSKTSSSNKLIALLAVGFYGVHAANAETINYIISRSDSFSTLLIVASLVLYTTNVGKKYYLHLITLVLAISTKEVGVMLVPILFFYILLFEQNISLIELVTFKKFKNTVLALKNVVPVFVVGVAFFYLTRNNFFIEDEATRMMQVANSGASTTFSKRWDYFYSQWVVIVHYIGNFILPLDLSADPDLTYSKSIINRKVLLSLLLIISMVVVAFATSMKKERRPIAFGILWFFITLAPTSSFHPFGQFSNDHRTFLPYIGLVISVAWALKLLFEKYFVNQKSAKQFIILGSTMYIILVSLHAYGTYQRNIVWSSSETLWKDASTKSPESGQALMNYGLVLMEKGQYEETLPYFEKAIARKPYWAFSNINMGILKNAMGESVLAEPYFENAIRYQPLVPSSYIFYARFLKQQNRMEEAINQLNKGLKISPNHTSLKKTLSIYESEYKTTDEDRLQIITNSIGDNPTAEDYINQSLEFYKLKAFDKCISSCEKALKFNPNSAIAYNNICSAYNAMEQWEKAANACKAALEINPDFERARGNLNWSLQNISK